MSNQEVRDIVASLREGDEVEADFTITGEAYRVGGGELAVGPRRLRYATAVRVIKRAPLPEPPLGVPAWFKGEWWVGMPQVTSARRWFPAGDIGSNRWRIWEAMSGAVPAATPGGDE